MIITIDGEKIDYKLEQEKNVNEIILSLENWLNNYQTLITEIELDGKSVSPADRTSLMQFPIDSVDEINVSTSSVDEMSGENALEVLGYMDRFMNAFKARDPKIVSSEGIEGLKWLITSVHLAATLHGIVLSVFPSAEDNIALKLSKINRTIMELAQQKDETAKMNFFVDECGSLLTELSSNLQDFYAYLNSRIEENADLDKKIVSVKDNFVSLQDVVANISGDLQTGNEARALGAIQQVAIALDDLFKVLSRAQIERSIEFSTMIYDHRPMDKWVEIMLKNGREIIEAFHNNDTVLLGDLFEYEMKKELTLVPCFLDLLSERV